MQPWRRFAQKEEVYFIKLITCTVKKSRAAQKLKTRNISDSFKKKKKAKACFDTLTEAITYV